MTGNQKPTENNMAEYQNGDLLDELLDVAENSTDEAHKDKLIFITLHRMLSNQEAAKAERSDTNKRMEKNKAFRLGEWVDQNPKKAAGVGGGIVSGWLIMSNVWFISGFREWVLETFLPGPLFEALKPILFP